MNGENKKYQISIVFNYQKNGVAISENHTIRTEDKVEYIEERAEILKLVPSAKQFPDDEGEVAQTKEVDSPKFCKVHQKALRKGQYGWYCATKLEDGTWCKTRG